MNPTLLKDLILAGNRVACKEHKWYRKVFLFIDWAWCFQWTLTQHSIDASLTEWLSIASCTETEIQEDFTWEYKIVTPLPQLPQVWDTVEVLEICRDIPWFDEWDTYRKNMVSRKIIVEGISLYWDIVIEGYYFTSRMVAKCEPQKEQSIESEETFWEIIELNWKKYREII